MPRPKKSDQPIYNVDKMKFLESYRKIQYDLNSEFILEFQNAPLVRFAYELGGARISYVMAFMNHFAFCIMSYVSDDAVTDWPTRPLYAPIGANADRKFYFWRWAQNKTGSDNENIIPPRSFEAVDLTYDVFDENAGVTMNLLKDYINQTYYRRNEDRWTGVPAISATYSWSVEQPLDPSMIMYLNYTDLVNLPDHDSKNLKHDVQDLFQFWVIQKARFERFDIFGQIEQLLLPEYMPEKDEAPQKIESISNHNLEEFMVIDNRSKRYLNYDVEGNIIGSSLPETKNGLFAAFKPRFLYMYYDISLTRIGIDIFVCQVNLLTKIENMTRIPGTEVTLVMMFDNWMAIKKRLPFGSGTDTSVTPVAKTPEWFPGNFPKTQYNHMAFYGGHSFYIPDGNTIDSNMTRITAEAGYISIKFVTDALNTDIRLLPMRNTVAYGRWVEYKEPDREKVIKILKKQWWSLFSKWGKTYIVETREAAIELGKKGTIGQALIPGLTAITGLINTGSGLI